ncbi:MAG: hypothetical protein WCG27_04770 [Pseudomonadota bacterium]
MTFFFRAFWAILFTFIISTCSVYSANPQSASPPPKKSLDSTTVHCNRILSSSVLVFDDYAAQLVRPARYPVMGLINDSIRAQGIVHHLDVLGFQSHMLAYVDGVYYIGGEEVACVDGCEFRYAMDTTGVIVLEPVLPGDHYAQSVWIGEEVVCAGKVRFVNNVPIYADNGSWGYQPSPSSLMIFIAELASRGGTLPNELAFFGPGDTQSSTPEPLITRINLQEFSAEWIRYTTGEKRALKDWPYFSELIDRLPFLFPQ